MIFSTTKPTLFLYFALFLFLPANGGFSGQV